VLSLLPTTNFALLSPNLLFLSLAFTELVRDEVSVQALSHGNGSGVQYVNCFYVTYAKNYYYFFFLLEMKSSDAKASKCHLKFSSRMIIFIKLVYLSSVISLKWQ